MGHWDGSVSAGYGSEAMLERLRSEGAGGCHVEIYLTPALICRGSSHSGEFQRVHAAPKRRNRPVANGGLANERARRICALGPTATDWSFVTYITTNNWAAPEVRLETLGAALSCYAAFMR